MSLEMQKLKDYIIEINEKTSENNQYPILTSSKKGLFLQGDYFNKQVASKDNKGYKIIKFGEFTYRSMSDTGEFYINRLTCCGTGIVSPAYPVFKIKEKTNLRGEYLQYYFKTKRFQQSISLLSQGSTRTSIKLNKLKDVLIPIIPIREQELICRILDKAQELIDKRKAQIEDLDELVKSRFIDMCANGSSDYENWEKLKIEAIAEQKKGSMRTGPFGSSLLHSEFVDEGIFVLGIDNAVENHFTWNKMRYITNEKYKQLKNYTVYPGDVIITIMGTVGRSAVIPDDFPKAINTKHLACITLNKLIANPYFISYCIHEHPYVINQLKNESKGAIMDGLNLTIIRSIKIPLPPIEVQESFIYFMNQVDKLKFEMEDSLKELENNFNSLMQRAFKGDLFN